MKTIFTLILTSVCALTYASDTLTIQKSGNLWDHIEFGDAIWIALGEDVIRYTPATRELDTLDEGLIPDGFVTRLIVHNGSVFCLDSRRVFRWDSMHNMWIDITPATPKGQEQGHFQFSAIESNGQDLVIGSYGLSNGLGSTSGGKLYRSSDGGQTWQRQFRHKKLEDIESILYTEHGWFVGASRSKLYHIDSGFTRLGTLPIHPKRVTWAGFGFVLNSEGTILAINENDAIYSSQDGLNWKVLIEDPTIRPRMVFEVDGGLVFTSFSNMKFLRDGGYTAISCPTLTNHKTGKIEGCGYKIVIRTTQIYASLNTLLIVQD